MNATNDIFTKGALDNAAKDLIGKPLTILLDGGKRNIGRITGATVRSGHLVIAAEVLDEAVRKELGISDLEAEVT